MKIWKLFLGFTLAFGSFISLQVGIAGGFWHGLLMLGFAIPTAITFTLLGIAFEDYGKESST